MAKRIDEHRPSVINPEDYQLIACMYKPNGFCGELELSIEIKALQTYIAKTGYNFSRHEHGGDCHICGASFQYYAVYAHFPSGTLIKCGFDCAEKMDIGDATRFRIYRKTVQQIKKLKAGKTKAQLIFNEAGLERAIEIVHDNALADIPREKQKAFSIIGNIWGNCIRYGSLSENQKTFLLKLQDEWDNPKWDNPPESEFTEIPDYLLEGRNEITGEILSFKYDLYGRNNVLLKVTDKGEIFKLYGKLPRGLEEAEKGDIIKFKCKTKRSSEDKAFGFYSRPTKAEKV